MEHRESASDMAGERRVGAGLVCWGRERRGARGLCQRTAIAMIATVSARIDAILPMS